MCKAQSVSNTVCMAQSVSNTMCKAVSNSVCLLQDHEQVASDRHWEVLTTASNIPCILLCKDQSVSNTTYKAQSVYSTMCKAQSVSNTVCMAQSVSNTMCKAVSNSVCPLQDHKQWRVTATGRCSPPRLTFHV